MNRQRWILAVVLLGTLIVAVAVNLTPFLSDACVVAGRRLVMKQTGAPGCFEFWFNRYQGTAAAFLAAITAFYVVRPAYRQLNVMNRQVAVQLMEQAHRQALELEAERDQLRDFETVTRECQSLLDLYVDDNPHWAHERWHKQYFDTIEALRSKARVVVAAELRSNPSGHESAERSAFANNLAVLEHATEGLSFAFISLTSGHDPQDAEDWTSAQCEEAESYYRSALVNIKDAYQRFAQKHTEAVKEAWKLFHRFAGEALR